jgi:predicted kinase
MSGLPGTGKSHLAKLAAHGGRAVVLRSDALRKLLFPQPDYSAAESRTVYEASYALLACLVAQGYAVIFDATNLGAWARERAASLARRAGGAALIVQTSAPAPVARQRLEARGRPGTEAYHSDAGWDVYQRMRAALEPLTPQELDAGHLVVDSTDDVSMAAAAERIAGFLREAQPPADA